MCIIICKPIGIKLEEELYRECWKTNNDGVGIAYVDKEKSQLIVEKGLMNLKDALEAILAKQDLELMIHFRKVSKGFNNKDNTHPFLVHSFYGREDGCGKPSYSFAICHNGTINISIKDGDSDTRTYVRQVLGPWLQLDPDLFEQQYKRWTIEGHLGERNKLAIMRLEIDTGEVKNYILNENATSCHRKYGCWFSNYSYIPTAWDHESGYCMGHFHNGGGVDGEASADHLGWIWRESRKEFENLTTKAFAKELAYRKPMDDDYEHEGKKYSRIPKRTHTTHYPKPVHPITPTQTIIPGVSKIGTEDKQIVVRRDVGVLPKGDDEWDRNYNLAVALRNCEMRHLDKKDKKRLKQIAYDFCAATFGKEGMNQVSTQDMITFLRSEYISVWPAAKSMKIEEIDKILIDTNGIPDEASDRLGVQEVNFP